MSATTTTQIDVALLAGLIGGIDGITDHLRTTQEKLAGGLPAETEQTLSDLIVAASELIGVAEALEKEADQQRRQLQQQEAGQ